MNYGYGPKKQQTHSGGSKERSYANSIRKGRKKDASGGKTGGAAIGGGGGS